MLYIELLRSVAETMAVHLTTDGTHAVHICVNRMLLGFYHTETYLKDLSTARRYNYLALVQRAVSCDPLYVWQSG